MGRNAELFDEARRWIPGGVNSPVRAFKSVGGTPPFIASGSGCRIRDAEDRQYVDYVGSWGPLILGHAHPAVVAAVEEALRRGSSFGAPTEAEVTMARTLCERVPSLDMVRLVSSGTEATMAAIRLARGFTGRTRFVKMSGCYHGCSDALLVDAGSGVATLGIPGSPGVTPGAAGDTVIVPFNDAAAVAQALHLHEGQVAAVIVEPVAGNMGVVPPAPGYLEELRRLCTASGALLIFDEVMTGFRVGPRSAQGRYDVTPDLTCLGKVVGGGFPLAAYGGRRDIMERVAPSGPVYQAGTLSGNPVAVAAGLATLRLLDDALFEKLETSSARLAEGLMSACAKAGVPAVLNRVGSMMTLFFTAEPVTDYAGAKRADAGRYARYFQAMLGRGIYLAPSAFEAAFVGAAHDDGAIDETLAAHRAALEEL